MVSLLFLHMQHLSIVVRCRFLRLSMVRIFPEIAVEVKMLLLEEPYCALCFYFHGNIKPYRMTLLQGTPFGRSKIKFIFSPPSFTQTVTHFISSEMGEFTPPLPVFFYRLTPYDPFTSFEYNIPTNCLI